MARRLRTWNSCVVDNRCILHVSLLLVRFANCDTTPHLSGAGVACYAAYEKILVQIPPLLIEGFYCSFTVKTEAAAEVQGSLTAAGNKNLTLRIM
jgi:hypothetical protein